MAESGPVSEASERNKKKRAKKKKQTQNDEDSAAAPEVNIVAQLKQQIDEAKANKDFKKAQRLREQLWTIQDTAALGAAGPGAPEIDLSVLQIAPPTSTQAPPPPSSLEPGENSNVKTLRKLEKKLKSIEELKEKRAKGVKLEKTQLAKIATEDEVREEIKTLESVIESMTI